MPRLGPSLSGVLTATGSNVCAYFQEFLDHVKPPKNARIVKKKKKNPKENNRIADFLLGGAHDMRCKKLFGSMRSICVPSVHINTCKYV